jgi:Fic family protein
MYYFFRKWCTSPQHAGQRHIVAHDPGAPFNTLPELPPTPQFETPAVLRATTAARVALEELRVSGGLIPNQGVLINTIPLLESRASSEIENIVTTSDALFRFAHLNVQAADPATKEALRYRAALKDGFASLKEKPLSTSTAIRVCSRVKGTPMELRRIPGTQLRNAQTHDVIYTPPEGEALLRTMLSNWERFLHPSDGQVMLDPLIRMAIAHYQFEAIHPFIDGNGRTGRILNLLMLVQFGLLHEPVLYLSRFILEHRDDYYRGLAAVTARGAWEDWILYMLRAVEDTARWTTAKIHEIVKLRLATAERLKQDLPRLYRWELVDVLLTQPYSRIENVMDKLDVKRQAAARTLNKLVEVGMLDEIRIGRDKLFLYRQYLNVLLSDSGPQRSGQSAPIL